MIHVFQTIEVIKKPPVVDQTVDIYLNFISTLVNVLNVFTTDSIRSNKLLIILNCKSFKMSIILR